MAGDWIKMRTNLDTDPRVIEMAFSLGIPELHVIGLLWKVWAWADQHTLDGNALRVTCVTLDRFTAVTGFADALRKVGWLDGRDGLLSFPRFAEHNGQTAKNRAETNVRVAKHRNANRVTNVTPKPLPEREKRREEKSNTLSHTREAEKTNFPATHLTDPEFATVWDQWGRHLLEQGKPLTPTASEAQLYSLAAFSTAEAMEIVQFSIERQAKNLITNGDHRRRESPGPTKRFRSRVPSFEEGLLK